MVASAVARGEKALVLSEATFIEQEAEEGDKEPEPAVDPKTKSDEPEKEETDVAGADID